MDVSLPVAAAIVVFVLGYLYSTGIEVERFCIGSAVLPWQLLVMEFGIAVLPRQLKSSWGNFNFRSMVYFGNDLRWNSESLVLPGNP